MFEDTDSDCDDLCVEQGEVCENPVQKNIISELNEESLGGDRRSMKMRAKRHMDPVLRTSLWAQHRIDGNTLHNLPENNLIAYPTFCKLFNKVLKELSVYIRKNKGASGDCIECTTNNANLQRNNVLPSVRAGFKEAARKHHNAVKFIRNNKAIKMKIGAHCAQKSKAVVLLGDEEAFGSPGVWGSGENDGAAQWYTEVPSDGNNKGKHRVPSDPVGFKALVRVIHGFTVMVTLTPPWVARSGNPNFNCTFILETFLGLEQLWGRLPRRWYEHMDAGDGNWSNTTLLFWAYLVEVEIFDEVIICRHFVGHTHENVDGENSHIRGFVLGLLKAIGGAVIGHPDHLLRAFQDEGPKSIFNRKSKRCRYVEYLVHV